MGSEAAQAPKAMTEVSAEKFQPERTHLLAAAVMALILLLVIGAAPRYLFWLLFFPLLFAYWVIKSATIVGEKGIYVKYAFGKNKTIPWADFRGISFRGAGAFAEDADGTSIKLRGVTFNSLPRLEKASRGRIPDALTAGLEAADDKVVVVRHDGDSFLLTKEEYAELQKAKGSTGEIRDENDKPTNPASEA